MSHEYIALDREFLKNIIALYQQDDYVMIIDRNYLVRFISHKFAQSINTTPEHLLGRNYLQSTNIPDEVKSSVASSIEHNLSCSHSHEFLNINLNREQEYRILQMRYNPLQNPQTHGVIAVVIEGSQLSSHTSLYNFVTYLIKNKSINSTAHREMVKPDELLSKREHEIAFLLLFFRSPKKIAEVIRHISGDEVSAKTINNIISSKLFVKFVVYNIDALITKLHELNYQTKIPPSFLLNLHLDLALGKSSI